MNEIICPHCSKAFKIDESGYAEILKQVHDKEFEKQLNVLMKLSKTLRKQKRHCISQLIIYVLPMTRQRTSQLKSLLVAIQLWRQNSAIMKRVIPMQNPRLIELLAFYKSFRFMNSFPVEEVVWVQTSRHELDSFGLHLVGAAGLIRIKSKSLGSADQLHEKRVPLKLASSLSCSWSSLHCHCLATA